MDARQPHFAIELMKCRYFRLVVGEYCVIYRFDASSMRIVVLGKRKVAAATFDRDFRKLGDVQVKIE